MDLERLATAALELADRAGSVSGAPDGFARQCAVEHVTNALTEVEAAVAEAREAGALPAGT